MNEYLFASNAIASCYYLADKYLHTIIPMRGGGLLAPMDPVGYDDNGYRMTPSDMMQQFFIMGGSLFEYEEGSAYLFPATVGLLRMEVGINQLWGYVYFGNVITWYRRDEDFVPFCSEFVEGEF